MTKYSYQDFESDKEQVYGHLRDLGSDIGNLATLLQSFRCLFVDGYGYQNPKIASAIHRIVISRFASDEFFSFLNRCYYSLINRLHSYSFNKDAHLSVDTIGETIAELVVTLKVPPSQPANSPAIAQLRNLVLQFTETELYKDLEYRVQNVFGSIYPPRIQLIPNQDAVYDLKLLMGRYPPLYIHLLMNEDTSEIGLKNIKNLQIQRQIQFERELYNYALQELKKHPDISYPLESVQNPSLLSPLELKEALNHFTRQGEGSLAYKYSARQFLSKLKKSNLTTNDVRDHVEEYLTNAVQYYAKKYSGNPNSNYGAHRFNYWLMRKLNNIYPHMDHHKFQEHQLPQISSKLLDAFLPEPRNTEDLFMFIDLHSNLGATFTIGLLLKIILLCLDMRELEDIKLYQAERFSVLFNHYKNHPENTKWLVECLENWMIASSVNFGELDQQWHLIFEKE